MNCLVKFCLLLNLSSVFSKPYVIWKKGSYSCEFPDPRPLWYKGVYERFKDAQGISSPSGQGYDLAHVFSWANIGNQGKLFFDELFRDGPDDDLENEVRKFVEKLAEEDVQAIAPKRQASSQIKMVPHTMILDHITSGETLSDLNAEFITEAMDMWDEIVNHWNNNQLKFYKSSCVNMKLFLRILNSIPANLRFGRKKDNTAIGYNLDPMGGLTDQITDKEENMVLGTLDTLFSTCLPSIVGRYALKDKNGNWSCRTSTGVKKMP